MSSAISRSAVNVRCSTNSHLDHSQRRRQFHNRKSTGCTADAMATSFEKTKSAQTLASLMGPSKPNPFLKHQEPLNAISIEHFRL
jgi:hypothetical protein